MSPNNKILLLLLKTCYVNTFLYNEAKVYVESFRFSSSSATLMDE